jgi:hypothetical protein
MRSTATPVLAAKITESVRASFWLQNMSEQFQYGRRHNSRCMEACQDIAESIAFSSCARTRAGEIAATRGHPQAPAITFVRLDGSESRWSR